jgi:hypothetical protein
LQPRSQLFDKGEAAVGKADGSFADGYEADGKVRVDQAR